MVQFYDPPHFMIQFYNIDRRSTKQILLRGVSIYAILFGIYLVLSVTYTLLGLPKCMSNPIPIILENNGVWKSSLSVILIGPILEEISYRLWLSFKKRDVAIGLGVFCITHLSIFVSRDQSWYPYIALYIVGIAIAAAIWCFSSQKFWSKIRHRYGNVLIWMSIFLFGFVHILNCSEYRWKYLFVYLVLIPLPRIASAYVYTYYRLSIGFIYSVLFHMIENAIIAGPQLW